MKRFPLFLLLLLTSLRLVASVAGVALNAGEMSGKKAHYTAQHDAADSPWLLIETDPAEESEEDSTEGFHPADVPALAAWVLGFGLTTRSVFATGQLVSFRPAQPLFLLFQNFRI